jgi:hypothetical protein
MMTWQYIAGFFDGEGTVMCGFRSNRNCRIFSLWFSQTDREVLDAICAFLNAEGITANVVSHRSNGFKPKKVHRLNVCSIEGVYKALDGMYPFLVVKRAKAEEAMELIETKVLDVIEGRDINPLTRLAVSGLINGTLTIPA